MYRTLIDLDSSVVLCLVGFVAVVVYWTDCCTLRAVYSFVQLLTNFEFILQ